MLIHISAVEELVDTLLKHPQSPGTGVSHEHLINHIRCVDRKLAHYASDKFALLEKLHTGTPGYEQRMNHLQHGIHQANRAITKLRHLRRTLRDPFMVEKRPVFALNCNEIHLYDEDDPPMDVEGDSVYVPYHRSPIGHGRTQRSILTNSRNDLDVGPVAADLSKLVIMGRAAKVCG